ncbi:MAG: class I SAM-dependent methyltransferase [Chloroflexi bacterium]|nr:class I SAM-dependent methyltransferase [Chloroflexota bacterium]
MKHIHDKVDQYYSQRLQEHGKTHWGVDWNSTDSQHLRFAQLLKAAHGRSFSVLDYGCGYGELVNYLRQQQYTFEYVGYDIAAAMVAAAQETHGDLPGCRFTSTLDELQPADYVVASGIFNVRLDTGDDQWRDYIHQTIAHMWRLAKKGLAFNMLTSYSDKEYMRDYLYYADPLYWFDTLKRTYSRHVALLHDYGLYEFTMLVKHEA